MTIGLVTSQRSTSAQSLFSTPVLWAIRVFSWLAFLITSYLAIKSLGHGVSASCITGSADCDAVQTSSWSVWMGVPVAVLGLACYSTLAGLSVAAGFSNPRTARWLSSCLLMFSLLAALSGLWFIGLQTFALQKFCMWCMAVHTCGLAVAGLVLWGTMQGKRGKSSIATGSQPSLAALMPSASASTQTSRATLSPLPKRTPLAMKTTSSRPMFGAAVGSAFALLSIIVGGQLLFPASGATSERLTLREPIHLDGDAKNSAAGELPTHTANKIPTDAIVDPNFKQASASTAANDDAETLPTPGSDATAKAGQTTAAEAAPPKKRIVTFLDGALSLDVYRFPVLGSREAPHFVLEFVSYDCSHCRHTHKMVHRALERYGDQVAVIVAMMPGGIDCNKTVTSAANSISGACVTAKMATAVGMLDPEKFTQFHDWLMESRDDKDKPPTPGQVMQHAQLAVGRDRITSFPPDDFQKQIDLNIDLYARIQKQRGVDPSKGGLPLIVVGSLINAGEPASEEKFIQSWADELGVKPLAGPIGL